MALSVKGRLPIYSASSRSLGLLFVERVFKMIFCSALKLEIIKNTSSHDATSPAGTPESAESVHWHNKLNELPLSRNSVAIDEIYESAVLYHGTNS